MTRTDFLAAAPGCLIETPTLLYCDGYKYQARCAMVYYVGIFPAEDIITDLIVLRRDGWLWVAKYFAWDGASGPAIDTASNMRGSHAHDALAALMRKGLLPMVCRFPANEVIRRLMIDDGAFRVRADLYRAVLNQTSYWADPKNSKTVHVAP